MTGYDDIPLIYAGDDEVDDDWRCLACGQLWCEALVLYDADGTARHVDDITLPYPAPMETRP